MKKISLAMVLSGVIGLTGTSFGAQATTVTSATINFINTNNYALIIKKADSSLYGSTSRCVGNFAALTLPPKEGGSVTVSIDAHCTQTPRLLFNIIAPDYNYSDRGTQEGAILPNTSSDKPSIGALYGGSIIPVGAKASLQGSQWVITSTKLIDTIER